MILTLTPNPALDVTIAADHIDHGDTTRIDAAISRAGGKGINVARVLASQGVSVHAVAAVGERDLAAFADDLADVPHTLVAAPGAVRRSYVLVERDVAATTVLNERGSAQPAEVRAELAAVIAEGLRTARVLVVSGSVPPESPDDLVAGYVRQAHAAGVLAIVDATGPQLLAAAAAGADLVKPNRAELAETVGLSDPIAGARALQARGARTVLVSLGEAGMILVPPTGPVLRARLPRVLRGNPTGAGDAGVAGVASILAAGGTPTELLRRACAWSAAAVLAPLAGSIDPSHGDLADEVVLTYEPEEG